MAKLFLSISSSLLLHKNMHVKSNYIIHENVAELDYKATSDTKNNPDICLPNFAKWVMQLCMFTWYIGLLHRFLVYLSFSKGYWKLIHGCWFCAANNGSGKRDQKTPEISACWGRHTCKYEHIDISWLVNWLFRVTGFYKWTYSKLLYVVSKLSFLSINNSQQLIILLRFSYTL